MPIKSFADTSAVSLAYAFSDAADASEITNTDLKLVPFTTEGFTMSKEAKTSQAISGSRRTKGSKNTKGTAAGALTVEFGAVDFCLDMLQAALMNTWTDLGTGEKTIYDSDLKQYLAFEKTIRPSAGATEKQSHEKFFGTLVNDVTLEFGDGELITMAVNTMSAFADYNEAVQGVDGLGGSMAVQKIAPGDYEIADASNNLDSLTLLDENNAPLEMTFSTASLQIENNVREQPGLGHVFAAGMGMGKVAASLSGEVYYYDQTVLDTHMRNKRMKGQAVIETREGKFEFFFPNMVAQSPTSNAGGENQDYTTSLTLTAEEGVHDGVTCTMFVKFTPTVLLIREIAISTFAVDTSGQATFEGLTTNVADGLVLGVSITDESAASVSVPGITSQGGMFSGVADISTLAEGTVTLTVSISDGATGLVQAVEVATYSS